MVEEARNANVPRMRHRYSVRPSPSQQQQQQQPPLRQTAQAAGTGTTAVAVAAPSGVVRASAAGSRRSPGRRFHLVQSLWQPTPDEAPWYFAGAGGRSNRARSQLAMRKSSGYLARDSALPPARGASQPSQPVLTGTSWHWPLPATPAGGGGRAVAPCAAAAAPTACAFRIWGGRLRPVLVGRRLAIRWWHWPGASLYSDSAWFWPPQCRRDPNSSTARSGAAAAPVRGRPLDKCKSCSGRGRCLGSAFGGGSCASSRALRGATAPSRCPPQCLSNCSGRGECLEDGAVQAGWGTDCARGGPRRSDGSVAGSPGAPRRRACMLTCRRAGIAGAQGEFDWRLQVRGRSLTTARRRCCRRSWRRRAARWGQSRPT